MPVGGETSAQSVPEGASFYSLTRCPQASLLSQRNTRAGPPAPTQRGSGTQPHTGKSVPRPRWTHKVPLPHTCHSGWQWHEDPASGATNTPSHGHRAFELPSLGSSSRGWRSGGNTRLPFPPKFPAHLLSLFHTSPLAPLPSLCLKRLSGWKAPWLLGLPVHLRENTRVLGPTLPFPKCRSPASGSNLKTGSPRPVPHGQAVGVG